MDKRGKVARDILLLFSVCALVDFIIGYVKQRSLLAGVVSLVCGLFGTAVWVFLGFPGSREKNKDDSGAHGDIKQK